MSDRRPYCYLVEEVSSFALGRQATDGSRGVDDRLSECHDRAG